MLNRIWPHLISLSALLGLLAYGSNLIAKNAYDYSEQMKQMSNLADQRVKKVNDALAEERNRHEEIVKRMQQELEKNREEYESKIRELEKKKKDGVASFVDNHGNNPKVMADELSKSTGFKVYNNAK
jgi:hypothetical protein